MSNLWEAVCGERCDAPPISADMTADLAIIGAGFTGCAAALQAALQGASVVLLEANAIGYGGSGRNVGLVNAGLWLPPDEILSELGEVVGTRLIRELGDGPGRVFDLIDRAGIACEATRKGTLHLAHSPTGAADLEERFRQGNRHGAPLRLIDAAETAQRTGTDRFHGALFDPRAGTVQPLGYCRGLARAALEAGAALHAASPVSRVEQSADGWTVTANGHTVAAGALLVATNAYHQGAAGLAPPRFVPVSYCQFATSPLPPDLREKILSEGEGCWDTALVMSSFRLDQAGRLIVGGIGDEAGAAGGVHTAWARRKLANLFPEAATLPFEHHWSGRIAMTSDHIPKILRIGRNGLAVFGYSGRGISPGTVFGTAAATALLDGDGSRLPLPVTDGHTERFIGPRAAYYEMGAALAHLAAR